MYKRKDENWTKHVDFMLLDLLCLIAAFILAYAIRFKTGGAFADELYRELAVVYALLEIGSSALLSNLRHVLSRGYLDELVNVILLSLVSLAAVTLFIFAAHTSQTYSRLMVFYTALLFILLDYLVRIAYKTILLAIRSSSLAKPLASSKPVPLLVLSDSENVDDILNELYDDPHSNYDVKAIALTDYIGVRIPSDSYYAIMPPSDAADYICREWIDEVLIYLPHNATQPRKFINACMEMGVTIHQVLNIRDVEKNKQFIESLAEHTVLTTAFNYIAPYQAVIKRLFDIIGGLFGCLATLLIGLFVAPAIYIKSPGPVIFKQLRIGQNGRPFYIYKFRSMVMNADAIKKDLMAQNRVEDGMMFKMENDPRIIPGVGSFIRRTSLDEFPQFLNVLLGDMSLVGTRPPTLDEWEKYEYHHRARMAIRPGITGMWQVSGRSQITDFEKVVELDTYYITHFRLNLDLKILLKTVAVLFKKDGAM